MAEEIDDNDDLLAGPDAVRKYKRRNGKEFYARSGTRSQRNKIENLFENDPVMNAIGWMLWARLANEDGSQKYKSKDYKTFMESLDYDVAQEMALLIQRGDKKEDDEDEDEFGDSLDGKVLKQVKNSKRRKGRT